MVSGEWSDGESWDDIPDILNGQGCEKAIIISRKKGNCSMARSWMINMADHHIFPPEYVRRCKGGEGLEGLDGKSDIFLMRTEVPTQKRKDRVHRSRQLTSLRQVRWIDH